jgi:hypothetical protein
MTEASDLACPACGHEGPHGIHAAGNVPRMKCKGCGRTFRQTSALANVEPREIAGDKFVVTAAVSGSHVQKPFLEALLRYCEQNKAQLLVVPIQYHNPTSRVDDSGEWFDPRIVPYLVNDRVKLTPTLVLMGDVPTQPTAARPLSGLHAMSGALNSVFGHTKIALEAIPTRHGLPAKLVMTTGAVTHPDYSRSKAGKKGEFHHVMGALLVNGPHVRHIHAARDGSFYDLDVKYTKTAKQNEVRPESLTLGDLHAVRADKTALKATFGMIEYLNPRHLIMHDVLDFQSGSHHNDFFERYRLGLRAKRDVRVELELTLETCAALAKAVDGDTYIVASNHNEHICKWLENHHNALDTQNALIYHELKVAWLRALAAGAESFDPLAYWAGAMNIKGLHFMSRNESLVIRDVEFGQHGDAGPNGARGAIGAFVKTGSRHTIGHSHTPGIMDGVHQVGTTSLMDLGYNKGPSSWAHAHSLQTADGKRALLFIQADGSWTR